MPVSTQQTKISAFFGSLATTENKESTGRSKGSLVRRDTGANGHVNECDSLRLRADLIVTDDSINASSRSEDSDEVKRTGFSSQADFSVPVSLTETNDPVEHDLESSLIAVGATAGSIKRHEAHSDDRRNTTQQVLERPADDSGSDQTSEQNDHSSEPRQFSKISTTNRPKETKYSIGRIPPEHLKAFKRLLNTLLPVNYSPSFFQSIQDSKSAFSREVRWQTSPGQYGPTIGGIKCKLQEVPVPPRPVGSRVRESQLYIQAIGVLAPYRRFGIAGALLNEVESEAMCLDLGSEDGKHFGAVTSLCAHVWEANEEALEWYKRRGFVVESKEDEYYHKLRPQGAWLIRRPLQRR